MGNKNNDGIMGVSFYYSKLIERNISHHCLQNEFQTSYSGDYKMSQIFYDVYTLTSCSPFVKFCKVSHLFQTITCHYLAYIPEVYFFIMPCHLLLSSTPVMNFTYYLRPIYSLNRYFTECLLPLVNSCAFTSPIK